MKTEILAPAGNIDSLKSAVFYGADAVYFGLSEFNARMKADNFGFDNLSEWVDFCHVYGVKVYITLNTLIKNSEITKLAEFIYKATTCNVDAFIVADIASINLCKQICPHIPLHFSTQFGVHNLEGALRAKELGATRVILARETPFSEIKRIVDGSGLEVEVFVHGAMCVSFSGNCYLSSMIDSNSGNRGRCKQPCRLKYHSVISGKDGYYLSMKDLCLSNKIKELASIGVVSFKIEGRLKSPEYVASAVSLYKKALGDCIKKSDLDNLRSAYSRVNTESGYLDGNKCNLISSEIQNNIGLFIGKTLKNERLKNGLNKISFNSSRVLAKGDGIKIINDGKEICGAKLSSIQKENGLYVVYVSKNAPIGSSVMLTQNTKILEQLNKREIDVKFVLEESAPAEYLLTLSDEQNSVFVEFGADKNVFCENDNKEKGIIAVLNKGLEPFNVASVNTNLISNTFLPNSLLNNARKECKELLIAKRLEHFKKQIPNQIIPTFSCLNEHESNHVCVMISKVSDLTQNVISSVDEIVYMPNNYQNLELDDLFEVAKRKDIYLGIPTVLFENDIKVLYKTIEKYNTLLSGVYGNGQFCAEIAKKYNIEFFAGFGLNIVNNISASAYKKFVYSIELSDSEIADMQKGGYLYAYGKPELMTFVHCPNYANGKNCNDCSFDKGELIYSSKSDEYIVDRVKVKNCYFGMKSKKPLCLFSYLIDSKLNVLIDLRECENADFVFDNWEKRKNISGTTTGHYKKGVL